MIRRRVRTGTLAGSLALAVLPTLAAVAAAAPRGFFGVVPQGPLDPEDYSAMGRAGVETLRFELSWATIAPSPDGTYDWSAPDAIVAGAAAGGIRPLPFAYGTPPWVAGPPRSPAALAAWRAFLGAAVARYGPGGEFWAENPSLPRMPIRVWQIWNEQNSPTYWEPRPSVRGYADLLHAAHDAIAARDPDAQVILGGMYGTPFAGTRGVSAWRFLARLYERPGARRDFDGVAAHPYASTLPRVRAQVRRLRRTMAGAGDERAGLWITELGWASGGAAHPLNRGPAGQARRLRRAFTYLLDRGRRFRLANVTWYSWRDNVAADSGLCAWCPRSGLLRADGTPKPALDVFAAFAHAR